MIKKQDVEFSRLTSNLAVDCIFIDLTKPGLDKTKPNR